MKIASWNVNGIRALLGRDQLHPLLTTYAPDVLCVQETKAQPEQVQLALPEYPYCFWNSAVKKGYAGTAIVSKSTPLRVHYGLGVAQHDCEGRIIAAEFDALFVVSVYVPNAKRDLSRLADRQDWDRYFCTYLQTLAQHKPVVCCGDFNVAHMPIDLTHPKANVGQHGFTQEERDGFQRLLDAGFVDAFRHLHPDEPGHYTWWRQFGGARERNVGWRIDYTLLTAALLPHLCAASILTDIYGSDHCPVAVEVGTARPTVRARRKKAPAAAGSPVKPGRG